MAQQNIKNDVSQRLCTDAALLKALADNCYNLIELMQDLPDADSLDAADAQVQLLIISLNHIQKDVEEAANQIMKGGIE